MNQYLQTLIQEQAKARDLNEKISTVIANLEHEQSMSDLASTMNNVDDLVQYSQALSGCLEVVRVNLIEANDYIEFKTKSPLSFDLYIATLKLYREAMEIQDGYYNGLIKDIEMYFVNESKTSPHIQIEQKKTRKMLLENISEKLGSIKKNTQVLTDTLSTIIERMDDFTHFIKNSIQ